MKDEAEESWIDRELIGSDFADVRLRVRLEKALAAGLFAFINRNRSRVLTLYWYDDGYALWYR